MCNETNVVQNLICTDIFYGRACYNDLIDRNISIEYAKNVRLDIFIFYLENNHLT